MAVEEKGLDFFKQNTGIKLVTSKAEAQEILDLAIHTMQQEGVTVWRPPSHEFEQESNNTIQLNNIEKAIIKRITSSRSLSCWIDCVVDDPFVKTVLHKK